MRKRKKKTHGGRDEGGQKIIIKKTPLFLICLYKDNKFAFLEKQRRRCRKKDSKTWGWGRIGDPASSVIHLNFWKGSKGSLEKPWLSQKTPAARPFTGMQDVILVAKPTCVIIDPSDDYLPWSTLLCTDQCYYRDQIPVNGQFGDRVEWRRVPGRSWWPWWDVRLRNGQPAVRTEPRVRDVSRTILTGIHTDVQEVSQNDAFE